MGRGMMTTVWSKRFLQWRNRRQRNDVAPNRPPVHGNMFEPCSCWLHYTRSCQVYLFVQSHIFSVSWYPFSYWQDMVRWNGLFGKIPPFTVVGWFSSRGFHSSPPTLFVLRLNLLLQFLICWHVSTFTVRDVFHCADGGTDGSRHYRCPAFFSDLLAHF